MEKIVNDVVVVKVGTSTLINKHENGSEQLDKDSFNQIGEQVIRLQERGAHVALVSSAAITAGMVATGLEVRPKKNEAMPNLQRLASIGWRHILNAWDEALGGLTTGGLLLTQQELSLEHERSEALLVTHSLMSHGDVAVINENDAITHKEIEFGDNDTLAATFAAQMGRSGLFGGNVKLILLSDIDGVYEDITDSNSLIREITDVESYEHLAGGTSGGNGTGGMQTKFEAARIARDNGVQMWIANGRVENAIERALLGEAGTHFA